MYFKVLDQCICNSLHSNKMIQEFDNIFRELIFLINSYSKINNIKYN